MCPTWPGPQSPMGHVSAGNCRSRKECGNPFNRPVLLPSRLLQNTRYFVIMLSFTHLEVIRSVCIQQFAKLHSQHYVGTAMFNQSFPSVLHFRITNHIQQPIFLSEQCFHIKCTMNPFILSPLMSRNLEMSGYERRIASHLVS